MSRIVSWFSNGAASAVATKLAILSSENPVTIYNCEIIEEHPDNRRFLRDCEEWFGQEIIKVGSDEYERSTDKVFRETRWLVGPKGARCTSELKKAVRWEYGEVDDVVVMGFTKDEQHRVDRLKKTEPFLNMWPILIEKQISKDDCFSILRKAGIELPEMYKLGYKNNNCIGCVKGGMGYWNKIKKDFPWRFKEMAQIERELNVAICKTYEKDPVTGKSTRKRVFLDELKEDRGNYSREESSECGFFCNLAMEEIEESS